MHEFLIMPMQYGLCFYYERMPQENDCPSNTYFFRFLILCFLLVSVFLNFNWN